MYNRETVTAIIPAYNEAQAIGSVVTGLKGVLNADGLPLFDDIIVCDNASTDDTAAIARHAGARVVFEAQPGYGAACQAGIKALKNTDIVVFVDGDCSVVAEETPLLLEALKHNGLVIGSRALGYCEPGAVTLPQHIGNKVASLLIRLLWNQPVSDLGPFRAICFNALQRLDMKDTTFGWTVEMQVKAIQRGITMAEVPVTCRARVGASKISGTVRGVVGAAYGILTTIFKLWWQQFKTVPANRSVSS